MKRPRRKSPAVPTTHMTNHPTRHALNLWLKNERATLLWEQHSPELAFNVTAYQIRKHFFVVLQFPEDDDNWSILIPASRLSSPIAQLAALDAYCKLP